jgi:hypothetical protein
MSPNPTPAPTPAPAAAATPTPAPTPAPLPSIFRLGFQPFGYMPFEESVNTGFTVGNLSIGILSMMISFDGPPPEGATPPPKKPWEPPDS